MYARTTVVVNETGIHARPASDFVRLASTFACDINVRNITDEEDPINAKSIIAVLSQGMTKGCEIEISAEGSDEVEAVDAMIEAISTGFGEA